MQHRADPTPGETSADTVTRADVEAAAARIAGHVRRTPLWRVDGATFGLPGVALLLKLEHLQASGSFKARGMFNRLLAQRPLPDAGVIVASGGNAAIAVATAARALGVRCEVFVPEIASPAKLAALAALDARVVVGGAAYADALAACVARQRETGALVCHAYDQAEVVAGAGTLALEIEADTRDDARSPDRVLVSVGGGGLIAGIAAAFEGRARVVALESTGTPTLHAALAAGEPVDVAVSGIAADALGARRIGRIAWDVCRRHVADAVLLDDAAIAAAQRALWRELRLVVEPSAALGLAALMTGAVRPAPGERVALVLCGANCDPAALAGG